MILKVLLHHYGRFTSLSGREFIGGMVSTIDPVELDTSSTDQVKLILTNCLGYDENSPTFLYIKKPNCSFKSGLIPLADAIQEHDMILTLLIKTAHTIFPISTRLSSTIESCLTQTLYFFSLTKSMAYYANEARRTIVSKLQRELEAEATLANQLLCNLTHYFEQIRSREIQMTMLQNMATMSLNSYGLHDVLMTHEADIRTTNILITARQELLRSIATKQNFINSYMAI
nr:hypothetical protein [Tanacetum cinerariifolium]